MFRCSDVQMYRCSMFKMPKFPPDAVLGLSSESIDRVSRIHFVLGTKVLGSQVPEILLRRSPLLVLTPCNASYMGLVRRQDWWQRVLDPCNTSLHGASTVVQFGGNVY
jgi:hypothetical protein